MPSGFQAPKRPNMIAGSWLALLNIRRLQARPATGHERDRLRLCIHHAIFTTEKTADFLPVKHEQQRQMPLCIQTPEHHKPIRRAASYEVTEFHDRPSGADSPD